MFIRDFHHHQQPFICPHRGALFSSRIQGFVINNFNIEPQCLEHFSKLLTYTNSSWSQMTSLRSGTTSTGFSASSGTLAYPKSPTTQRWPMASWPIGCCLLLKYNSDSLLWYAVVHGARVHTNWKPIRQAVNPNCCNCHYCKKRLSCLTLSRNAILYQLVPIKPIAVVWRLYIVLVHIKHIY